MTAFRLPAVLRLGPKGMRQLRRLLAAGDAAIAARDWAAAEAACAAALVLDPGLWPIAVQWGHALKEQGFLHGAEAAYRRALRRKPEVADTHLQLGHALKLQGRRAEAAQAYCLAYRLAPGEASRRELAALGAPVPEGAQRDNAALLRAWRASDREAALPPPADEAFVTALDGADPGAPRSLDALLVRADLTPAFLPLFDEAFYLDANPAVRRELPAPTRLACLAHFGRVGLPRLLAFHPGKAFDPDFYRDTALGGRAVEPAAAYRHWLTLGLPRGEAANPADFLVLRCGIAPGRAASLPAPLRTALVALERSGGSWIDAFDERQAARRPGADDAGSLTEVFVDRAARLLGSGNEAERAAGARLAQRIRTAAPGHPRATLLVADHLLRVGAPGEAVPLYEALDASPAATLGLAASLDALGRSDDALGTLDRGRQAFPGDTRLDRAFAGIAEAGLHRAFRLAVARGEAGEVEEAAADLACAVERVAARLEPRETLPARPIRRVAIVGNRDLDQCRLYRVEGKLEQLAAGGRAARFFDYHAEVPRFLGQLHRFDAVIFYRVPADFAVMTAVARARAAGLLTIYEIDDLIFEAAHYPPPLASYGGAIEAREHLGLRLGVPLIAAALRLCDVALASTPALAEAMRPCTRTGRALVHRNAMGRAHEAAAARPRPPRDAGAVTLFYGSNTKAHAEDFTELVEPALVELVRRHGTALRIVLVGHVPAGPALAAVAIRHEALAIADYWALLSTADISIAVLKPSPMADAKSEIKWLEAAMLGVPSVVSDTATYREVVTPDVDGFLCAAPSEWLATLGRLVSDPALRRRVGARARQTALDRYGAKAAADGLDSLLAGLSPPAPPRRPKLLIVNVYYAPQLIGGATRVVHDNMASLVRDGGFDVEVFTTTDGGDEAYALSTTVQDGVRVTAASIPAMDGIDRVPDLPGMGAAFADVLAASRPDLVHFHCIQRLTPAVIDAARAAGIPYVVTVHDGWWVSDEQFIVDRLGVSRLYDYADPAGTRRRLGPEAAARMARLAPALAGAARVLAVSNSFAALHARCGLPDVIAIPNGLSAGFGAPPRPPAAHPRLRLGFLAGLHAHKGWRLIEAALGSGSFEGMELVAVDHELAPGETRFARLGATPVTFVPRVPPDAVGALYAAIDVLLAPSIWPESFGLVVREALACGLWVIASDRGAIGEDVVDGVNGFVVDVSGPAGLAAALARMAADPGRYRSPPAPSRLRTAEQQGQELAALYRAVLAGDR